MKNEQERKALVHRISRLEGQLASVKAELIKGTPDCARASRTLTAASRSFASLRHAFVQCFLEDRYIASRPRGGEYEALLGVING